MIEDKRLAAGSLADMNTTLYEVPEGKKTFVKAITICNTAGSPVTFTIKFDGWEVIKDHIITANNTLTVPFLDQILHSEEKIEGEASGTDIINYYISGKEVT